VTVYSVATGVQYINTEDDRVRGHANNPLDPAASKLMPKGSDSGRGPFAGDVAIYALDLYSSPTLKRSAGSAVYTCFFNYDQHALCKAYFKQTIKVEDCDQGARDQIGERRSRRHRRSDRRQRGGVSPRS